MEITDQLHRKISLNKTPQRIVSLVPSQTELLVDLGLEAAVVGITKFCVHPEHLRKTKTVVGGTKQVHISKIKNLKPDIIICNKEENTEAMVTALSAIAPVWVSDINSISDGLQMISAFGNLFQKKAEATQVISEIEKAKRDFDTFITEKPFRKTYYFIWKNPYMIAGKGTFIDAMLQLNHFENGADKERYPEVDLKQVENAELLLLSSEPYPFKENDIEELKNKFPKAVVKLVDGEYFSWYGTRLKNAFAYFKSLHEPC
jgi:iron complex transport system substrate-binding protein